MKKIYLANYTPPIGIVGEDGIPRGCMFGVDMPPNDNFIARDGERNRTLNEISNIIRMEVFYLSPENMLNVYEKLGMSREHLCTYCIGGKHPFEREDTLPQPIQKEYSFHLS